MVLNLLFLLLKIKNLWDPSAKTLFLCTGGLGGQIIYILLLYKSTYIAKNAPSANPVNTGVQILIKNKGCPLWEFWCPLWEFWCPLWEFWCPPPFFINVSETKTPCFSWGIQSRPLGQDQTPILCRGI